MALVVKNMDRISMGNKWKIVGQLAFDSSYPTGGYSLSPSLIGLDTVESMIIQPESGYTFEYLNGKVKVFVVGGFTPAGIVSQPTFSASGSELYTFSVGDIAGSENTDSPTTDQASMPTNGNFLKSADTFTNYNGTITPTAQPDIARNVCIVITNDSGSSLDLYEGTTTYTITGTYKGASVSDTIQWTCTSANKTIANGKYRYMYSTKPFDTITSITYDNSPAGALKAMVGIGSKIGLPKNLLTPSESDITKLRKNTTSMSPTGLVDLTNHTVNFGSLVDDDDIMVVYKVLSGDAGIVSQPSFMGSQVSPSAMTEVSAGTNLSSLNAVEFEAIGL